MEDYRVRSVYLWSLWIMVVPLSFAIVYRISPPTDLDFGYLAAFAVFAVLLTLFPLSMNGNNIFIIQWATLAVFLKYGLFVEMIVIQAAVLLVTFRTKSTRPFYFRIPFNSLMFLATSVIAGAVFFSLGGQIGSDSLLHILIYGTAYQLVYFLVNHLILCADNKVNDGEWRFVSVEAVWDFVIMLLILPFTLVLYLVELHIGVAAIYLLGLPFVVASFFLRKYSDSERINRDLKKATEIGHQLAGRMTSVEVIELFMVKVAELLSIDFVYVVDYRRSTAELVILRQLEDSRFIEKDFTRLARHEGIAGRVMLTNKPVIYGKKEEWAEVAAGQMAPSAQSVMALPIVRNSITEGVLIVGARKKNLFADHQLQILEMLTSYFAVSLEKADLVQKAIAKSERCGLTKLYNYRYLEDSLEKLMNKVNSGELEQLSLMMMDIDFFKSINDRYGHQSGNDILVRVARLIEEEVGDEGVIARYGGEEFVVVLPGYGKAITMLLGETLRERIENFDFEIQSDLDEGRTLQKVKITMSIGVSSAPEDSDDAMSLIRNADRALYIGAKQAGRNKVAGYSKS
ncbi:sensor domain-containing diguanylate cyclase [Indiicoccus explosivorum]|uniref:sensor domain-containing diguanylate cyclase n=1 Tax=Indiicoccus explosivorum TaxID=1917864 RepID=UPI000B43DAFC|nr:sensor domain-containing diguanylate cyclase [Indiicoccus explosivorum]